MKKNPWLCCSPRLICLPHRSFSHWKSVKHPWGRRRKLENVKIKNVECIGKQGSPKDPWSVAGFIKRAAAPVAFQPMVIQSRGKQLSKLVIHRIQAHTPDRISPPIRSAGAMISKPGISLQHKITFPPSLGSWKKKIREKANSVGGGEN